MTAWNAGMTGAVGRTGGVGVDATALPARHAATDPAINNAFCFNNGFFFIWQHSRSRYDKS
jgi:hypothetical protein